MKSRGFKNSFCTTRWSYIDCRPSHTGDAVKGQGGRAMHAHEKRPGTLGADGFYPSLTPVLFCGGTKKPNNFQLNCFSGSVPACADITLLEMRFA